MMPLADHAEKEDRQTETTNTETFYRILQLVSVLRGKQLMTLGANINQYTVSLFSPLEKTR